MNMQFRLRLETIDSLEQVSTQRRTRRLRNAGGAELMLLPSPMVSESNFGDVFNAASIDWSDPAIPPAAAPAKRTTLTCPSDNSLTPEGPNPVPRARERTTAVACE